MVLAPIRVEREMVCCMQVALASLQHACGRREEGPTAGRTVRPQSGDYKRPGLAHLFESRELFSSFFFLCTQKCIVICLNANTE